MNVECVSSRRPCSGEIRPCSSSSSRRQICQACFHTKLSQTRLLPYAQSNSQLFRLRLNCSRVLALRMFEWRPFQFTVIRSATRKIHQNSARRGAQTYRYLCKAERFEQAEKIGKVAGVVGDQCASSDDRLVTIQLSADVCVGRQRPEKPGQSFDVTALFQRLTHSRHLVRAELAQQRWSRKHACDARQHFPLPANTVFSHSNSCLYRKSLSVGEYLNTICIQISHRQKVFELGI